MDILSEQQQKRLIKQEFRVSWFINGVQVISKRSNCERCEDRRSFDYITPIDTAKFMAMMSICKKVQDCGVRK